MAWDEWAKIFEQYPQLIKDEMADDLREVINRYKRVLDQLDEEFPRDFKLQILVQEKEKEVGPPAGPEGPAGGPGAEGGQPPPPNP